MIIFDTETTGLLKPSIVELEKQPKIIEFAAIKLNDETLEEVDSLDFLVNPNEPISKEITKITRIDDRMVKDSLSFKDHYQKLKDFFKGEKYLIAHNLAFDINVLKYELLRNQISLDDFNFPEINICTVNKTVQIKGYRLKLSSLHFHCFGEDFKEAHRAMNDVKALKKCVVNLINNEWIKL